MNLKAFTVPIVLFCLAALPAFGVEPPVPSTCIAMAQSLPNATFVAFSPAAGNSPHTVTITFVDHSTYLIESPKGVNVATDYNGWAGVGILPRVVTMNRAHSTHYTDTPDPGIEYVLRGWNPDGSPARHSVLIDDLLVRNVTTDIRFGMGAQKDGNSIFIFEVAGLCIGHLGHLHHELDDSHYAAIGRLDVLMVPVDGGLTLSHEKMTAITRRLHSSIILPMHRIGAPVREFVAMMGPEFGVDYRDERYLTVSLRSLPRRPTIIVLAGM